MTASPPDASDRPFYTRKFFLIPAGLLVVAAIALGFVATWEHHDLPRTVRDAAQESMAGVPDEATEISASYDRIRIQGGCSTLTFLPPNAQWRSYTATHMVKTLDPTTFGPSSGCEPVEHDCVEEVGTILTGYAASDHAGEGGNARHLYVIPDCESGRALIAWSTFDL
ncbi:hypothetical protein [Williamsia sp. 1135]|uniref:hypothetical protein n=1 Tax=Williamsia sp. 1135 TaxID=1889262 RepID=UPI000A1003D9|nr:hypothetical protein [Williamsia sp. 1135]ORM30107.1 hypothetical protein BFL43_18765 [Williamsia sp. 1135]